MRSQRSRSSFDRRLIGMGVLAVIAIGIFLLVQFGNIGENAEEEEPSDLPPVEEALFPDAGFGTVVGISITDNETGEAFVATQDADGVWTIEEALEEADTGLGVDEPRLGGALIALPSLVPSRSLSEIEALVDYGLGAPPYTITFDVLEADTYTFDVGNLNPDGTAYYVHVPGRDTTVYLVSSFNIDPLIGFVTDPPFIPSAEDEGTPDAPEGDG